MLIQVISYELKDVRVFKFGPYSKFPGKSLKGDSAGPDSDLDC